MEIDYDSYDGVEDGFIEGGGGGGGKKKRKKEIRQGPRTQDHLKETVIQASKSNVLERAKNRPEMTEDMNTDIEVTLRRLIEIDEDVVGLPSLEAYMQWVFKRVTNIDDWPDIESECKLTNHTSGGPGGQNRNKVATAVRLDHEFTGIRLEASDKTTQIENKKNALERAEKLVREHLDRWADYVTEREGDTRSLLAEKMDDVLEEQFTSASAAEDKRVAYKRIVGVIGRR